MGYASEACNMRVCGGAICLHCMREYRLYLDSIIALTHSLIMSQMVSPGAVRLTVAGLGSARAQKLVAAGLIVELAAILHLRTAGSIARATRRKRATHKLVQVQVVGVFDLVPCKRTAVCVAFRFRTPCSRRHSWYTHMLRYRWLERGK